MELGGVAYGKSPGCDEAGCPWRGWCDAYTTGDFTAPDVPEQPAFEGSRRQFRGRIVRTLTEYDELPLDELGPSVRVDYSSGGDGNDSADSSSGEYGREWLRGLLADLADDGLVELHDDGDEPVARLRR
jgi:A/G-specific adenine glycosylase